MSKLNDLRVWWVPQLGCGSTFYVPVPTLEEAGRVLDTLARYDLFQLEHHIKPDYCNVGGVQQFNPEDCDEDEGDGWTDWYSEEGEDFDEYQTRIAEQGASHE